MRRPLDSTRFYDKMCSTRPFYENTVGQPQFCMARCFQQDLFMRTPSVNKRFSWEGFRLKPHDLERRAGGTRPFGSKVFQEQTCDTTRSHDNTVQNI